MSRLKNQARGARSKALGDQFEKLIELSCKRYKNKGKAYINKTFPPFTTIRRQGNQVVGFYNKSGQPDFTGTLKNGRSVVFEAKHTNSTNLPFERVAPHQKQALNALGSIENGRWSSDSKVMKDLLTCDYFSPKQQQELKKAYKRMQAREWEMEEEE